MSGVDDLFGGDAPPPPVPDRTRLISRLLMVAAPLNLLGIACCTSVPGAILTLVAWQLADEDLARVESGALPADRRVQVTALRRSAFVQMGGAALSLFTQVVLFGFGVYEALLKGVFEAVQAFF